MNRQETLDQLTALYEAVTHEWAVDPARLYLRRLDARIAAIASRLTAGDLSPASAMQEARNAINLWTAGDLAAELTDKLEYGTPAEAGR